MIKNRCRKIDATMTDISCKSAHDPEILMSALVLRLLFLRMEDLEIDMYMFFLFDIDLILTMIRPGLDYDRTRTRTRA